MIAKARNSATTADERAVRDAFLRATQSIARVDEQVFAHMRRSQNPDIVDQIAPLTLDALRPLVEQLTSALSLEAWRIAEAEYGSVARRFSKDGRVEVSKDRVVPGDNHFAREGLDLGLIRRRVAKLVVDISNDQRKSLKRIIARRFDPDRLSNDTMVKDIKATVGLTERESVAVMNFRDTFAGGKVPQPRIDSEVERYANKLHKLRAERIARTETVAVETTGRRQGWKAAQKDGLLSRQATVEWVAHSGCCDACTDLNGEKVSVKNGLFRGPDGPIHGPPAHPHCLCDVVASDEG